jgi:uncharacterized LabA/DUF88 family protein
MSTSRGKTICFVDDRNIFHGQIENGWKIDWERFIKLLQADGEVWQVYYFASETDPPSPGETSYYQFLKEGLRWEVFTYSLGSRTLTCGKCNHSQTMPAEKGVDVGLATKMLMLGINRAYETAVLVSGDRDYLETVKFIKGLGLRVEIVSWRNGLSNELGAESSAPVLYLDDLADQIARK